jgi:hypothetical protein
LFRQRPLAVQVILAAVLPIAYGALCGYVLGASLVWFNVLMLLAGVGGVGGGFEHPSPREAAVRGIAAGVLFAAALLAMFELRGVPSLTPLPAPVPVMAVIYAVMGVPVGMIGGWLRSRAELRRAGATS